MVRIYLWLLMFLFTTVLWFGLQPPPPKLEKLPHPKPRAVLDFTPAVDIQELVDRKVADGDQQIDLPAGTFILTKPLVVGNPNELSSIRLVGAGCRADNHTPFGGTSIVATFSGPAIILKGGRNSSIENLSVYGPYFEELKYQPFRGADRNNWPSWDVQYNPSCGIAVDLTNGGSGHTLIKNVEVGGFGVGIITYPDGGDGNGDFLSIERCRFFCCRDGLSITHTQSRTVRVDRCTFQCLHTGITNCDHGKALGEIDGFFLSCDFNQVQRICHFTQAYAGPCVFQSCYGELIGNLGNFYTGWSRATTRTVFRDCRFNMDLDETSSLLLDAGGGGNVLLEGGIYSTRDITVAEGGLQIQGAKFRTWYYEQPIPFSPARRLAANLSRGILPRFHPMMFDTRLIDVKTVTYFPEPLTSDFCVAHEGPEGPIRRLGVWEKNDCVYFEDNILFPLGTQPRAGGFVQCDREGLTTWVILAVSGSACQLERINNVGKPISTEGYFYLMQGDN